jgi:hypothetical protein
MYTLYITLPIFKYKPCLVIILTCSLVGNSYKGKPRAIILEIRGPDIILAAKTLKINSF